jgi:hypothetical protein
MYSGFPTETSNEDEKEAYVSEVNAGMGWVGGKKLQASQIENNTALRNFYKLLMNALLGKVFTHVLIYNL